MPLADLMNWYPEKTAEVEAVYGTQEMNSLKSPAETLETSLRSKDVGVAGATADMVELLP